VRDNICQTTWSYNSEDSHVTVISFLLDLNTLLGTLIPNILNFVILRILRDHFTGLELLHMDGQRGEDEKHNIIYNSKYLSPLDGISTLSKALCCWVRGLVCTNELYAMPAAA
jgi:hypothetical protein